MLETLETGERMTRFVVSHERVLVGSTEISSQESNKNKRMINNDFDKDTILLFEFMTQLEHLFERERACLIRIYECANFKQDQSSPVHRF